MSGHTPGPWAVNLVAGVFFVHADGRDVCSLRRPRKEDSPRNAEWTRADAELIAAAPDLLAALEAFVSAEESFRESTGAGEPESSISDDLADAYDLARAAIAKATT